MITDDFTAELQAALARRLPDEMAASTGGAASRATPEVLRQIQDALPQQQEEPPADSEGFIPDEQPADDGGFIEEEQQP